MKYSEKLKSYVGRKATFHGGSDYSPYPSLRIREDCSGTIVDVGEDYIEIKETDLFSTVVSLHGLVIQIIN